MSPVAEATHARAARTGAIADDNTRRVLLAIAAVCTAAAIACILVLDAPVARWIATRDTAPGAWDTGIGWLEYAGGIEPWKWIGVCVLVGGVIATLVVPRWQAAAPAWLFVASTHLAARNVMLWGKTLTGRLRPQEWLAHHDQAATFFSGGVSFPSGHVMLFASLAVPIAIVWPRVRLAAALVVVFAMCARVAVNAHFLSDVLAGLAVTALVTYACARAIERLPWPTPPASPR